MKSARKLPVKPLQAGYIVVGRHDMLLDVSPTTTLRRAIRVAAYLGLGIWLLSLTGLVIA